MRAYFRDLEEQVNRELAIARAARVQGWDPEQRVEIPVAHDLAERVENLVGPTGIAERIREFARTMNREEISLAIAKEVISKGRFASQEEALEQAVRTGLAILTEGVLVAPIDGMTGVKIKHNPDGSDYVDVFFSGPIRAAGGTAQALSVLIADVGRRALGIGAYQPTLQEIERFKEEIPAYKAAQHLQYTPSAEEVAIIVSSMPVSINGEGTEKVEISGNRDLPRVETNRLRGGPCLVLAEGLCLKAPKVLKHVRRLGLQGWDFLEKLEHLHKAPAGEAPRPLERNGAKSGPASGPRALTASALEGADLEGEIEEDEAGAEETDESAAADEPTKAAEAPVLAKGPARYIKDLIAGRPVFSHPSRQGGFRLRYGRARTAGLAAIAVHPATMYAVGSFLAVGTQMKIERPGKAGAVTPCDTIEGPVLQLRNGDVVAVESVEEFRRVEAEVETILDLGEILIPFGEFVENNKELVPGAWCFEWWVQELESKRAAPATPENLLHPSFATALELSRTTGVALHPDFTFFWSDLTAADVYELASITGMHGRIDDGRVAIPDEPRATELLVKLTMPFERRKGRLVVSRDADAFLQSLGLAREQGGAIAVKRRLGEDVRAEDAGTLAVGALLGVTVRAKAPTRIGARMGRPEKARERLMKPPVHTLFPIGGAGGAQRLLKEAARGDEIRVEVASRRCTRCDRRWPLPRCACGGMTQPVGQGPVETKINLNELVNQAKADLGMKTVPDVKAVRGLISEDKIPEALHKGLLRAKHGVTMFRDGTIRFDLTDVPATHVRPREIGLSVAVARKLGYDVDWKGAPLESADQLLELRPQDLVLARSCGAYLLKVARFVDDELSKIYGLDPHYNAKTPEDLVGQLVIGLAPHTSGGVLGRILGFTPSHAAYAHPFFHAAKRRNCDGDEDCVMLLLDGFLNFSKRYLPSSRGGQMDAPLVLSVRIDPNEIDKEAHAIDVGSRYPLAVYEAAAAGRHPNEVAKLVDSVGSRIGTPAQYEGFSFTHDTADISAGPVHTAYSGMGSMEEKMEAQLDLATRIRAVDASDVAARVIETHFLPDLIGNLKAFSRQGVRCASPACGHKYRRIPLKGVCLECGGALLLSVHESSVKKYLEVTKRMAAKYDVSPYIRQRVALAEESINALFENDKVKRMKIEDFAA
jgi:DNA polymerase II large subunit